MSQTATGRPPLRRSIWAGRRLSIGRRLDPQRRLGWDSLNHWIDEDIHRAIQRLREQAQLEPHKAERLAEQIAELEELLAPPTAQSRSR